MNPGTPRLLRRCPNCGRRFTTRLLAQKLVNEDAATVHVPYDQVVDAGTQMMPAWFARADVAVERETFATTFECRSCHYKWTETVAKVTPA
jgi:DNA-directed RNA polymerase subunit M/transcription elongation factor TFIIS